MAISYVYLLQEREFVNSKEKVFKVGKTRQLNFERFRQYPKGSVILLYSECNDCDVSEKRILSVFRRRFIKRTDIGSEYFEGDFREMRFEINKIIYNLEKIPRKLKCEKKYKSDQLNDEENYEENYEEKENYEENYEEKENYEENEFVEEYFIEHIISHNGDFKDKNKMSFQVKWKGYDNIYNSFEPYRNLIDTEALGIYLKKMDRK